MKQKLFRCIGLILIVVGLVLIAGTIMDKIETKKRQQMLVDIFENQPNIEETENIEDIYSEINSEYKPIAIMEIPSINFTQGVVEGVENDAIKYYIGHFEETAMPGEKGNFAVAAHRISRYSDAFVNLHKLKQGDKVKVKNKEKEFVYEVTENYIVKPEQVDVLDKTEEATITLITCTVSGEERVIIKGNLIETNDI